MKSKITKIQKILMKGIAVLATGMMLASPIAYATTSLDDSYLESSWWEQILYGKIGSTAKEIEEYFNSRETTLYITNETQLRALAEYVNNGNDCSGKQIILLNDIEVDKNNEWVPIAKNGTVEFQGIFNGNNYTISGVRYSRGNKTYSEITRVGLFGIIGQNGNINNVVIKDSKIDIPYYEEEKNEDGTNTYNSTGIIVGKNKGTIKNCIINDCEAKGFWVVGGIAGTNVGKIENCISNVAIYGYSMIGGIAGQNHKNESDAEGKIINCTNKGKITGITNFVGGVAGQVRANATVLNSINEGIVVTEGSYVGGITGVLLNSTIENCYNTGRITGNKYSGGIAGALAQESITGVTLPNSIIKNSINEGKVIEGENSIGGIVKTIGSGSYITGCIDYSALASGESGKVVNLSNGTTIKQSYKITDTLTQSDVASIVIDNFDNVYKFDASQGKIVFKNTVGATIRTEQGITETIDATTGLTVTYKIQDGHYKAGDTIEISTTYNKKLYTSLGTSNTLVNKETAPKLTMKIDETTVEFDTSSVTISDKNTIVTYTKTVTDDMINGKAKEISLKSTTTYYAIEGSIPTDTTTYPNYRISSINKTIDLSNNNIIVDTVKPTINTKVYVENALATGRYTAGKEILFEVTTSETIQGLYEVPQIQVSFSESEIGKYNYRKEEGREEGESGFAKCKSAVINLDGTTTWTFSYIVQERDEGELEFTFTAGKITDLAGNITNIKELYTANKPEADKPLEIKGTEWDSNLGVTFKFYKNDVSGEEITSQTYFTNEDDLVVVATYDKVLYVYYGQANDSNANTRLTNAYKDKAPSLYLNGTSNLKQSSIDKVSTTEYNEETKTSGKTTVQYRYTDIAKNYKLEKLTQITALVLKNENNEGTEINIADKIVTANGDIPYSEEYHSEYKSEEQNLYELLNNLEVKTTTGLDDIIIDPIGVSTKIEKSDIYADTTAPTVTITADKANPTNADLIKYTFKFSEVVEGFTGKDITVNNGIKATKEETVGEEKVTVVDLVTVEEGKEYTLEVKPTIPVGNEGILQVIVEEGVCTDLVSINNVRQENNITIDKVKPTLTSYEVKQETGKIKIEATFSEELSDALGLIPTLTIGGNASRGSWEDVEIYDNNKARYVYNVSGADGGKVEASLIGTVKDKAGNDSETLNIAIENDIALEKHVIKTEDGDEYSFSKNGIAVTDFENSNQTYFKAGDTIKVTKVGEGSYTYTVEAGQYDNNSYMKYMNLVEPAEGETIGTVTFSKTEKAGSIDISEANIYFDTTAPKVTTQITANNPTQNNVYTTGEEFTIRATTSESIQDEYTIPEINVKFGEKAGQFNNGKAEYIESIQNENGTTTWVYRYRVSEGDEGAVSLEYASGSIKDLAGNTVNNITTLNQEENIFVLNGIVVDTIAPTVTIDVKKIETTATGTKKTEIANNITNADKLEYTFTWSEAVTGFEAKDITVNNGNNVTFKPNETDKKVYTMTVDTTVETGNVGDIQVIVEKGACQDLVGHENVRTESVIRVDKQAPILLSLEAYANSNIGVDENVDTVKEYYKVGDIVTVVATFSENIENTTTVPTLALQFSESGNAKETVSAGTISGNKITYTYTITAEDMGTLSVKGFSGTVLDAAGNKTIVTKRNLNGDTIIADTKAPTLVGITAIAPNFEYDELLQDGETKRYGVQSKTRTENTITIIAEYSENVYNLSSNTINKITDKTIAPTLALKFSKSGNAKGQVDFEKVEGSKIYYKYDITSEDNGDLSIVSLSGTVSDIAGNTCTTGTSLPTLDKYEESIAEENEVNNITADTKNPTFTITATAVNYDDNGNEIGTTGYYRKGSVITIKAETNENEYVYKYNDKELTRFAENGSDAPQLNISFSTSGNGVGICTNVEYTNNQTIFTYTYIIKENDNGILNLNIVASEGYDIALNGNNIKTQSISNIIADTVNPVTNWQSWVESEQYGIVDNQNGTWTVTFSEILYVYDSANHKVGNQLTNSNKTSAPILLVSSDNQTALETTISNITTSGNKTVITYTYSPYTRNIGAYGMKFANVSDKAGNLFNYKDQKAPTLSSIKVTEPISGTYKAGQEITIVATFSEKVTGIAPTLALQFSESGDAKGNVSNGVIAENTITYKYIITATDAVGNGDNGVLSIKSFTGTELKDLSDNLWVEPTSVTLTGNEITADTIAPIVTITSDVERTNKDVVTYTFTWSEPVTGFTAEDVEVTNGSKGKFTVVSNKDNKVYTLEVDTTAEGRQVVKVNSGICEDIAGNLNVERVTYNKVVIDYTKPVIRAKVNGGNYVLDNTDPENKKSTLKETIVVNEEVSKFEYIWSKSTTMPSSGFETINPDEIQINSDINLEKQVRETGTYYLYMKITDLAGNTFEGRTNEFIVASTEIRLTPNTTLVTNKDVTVTVEYGEGLTENRKAGVSGLTQSADSNKVVIAENGTVYAEATDKAGNKVCKVLEIENIDKVAPEGTIKYVTNEDKSVTATISFNEENVTITNNNGKNAYVFEENGEFTFEFRDVAGNINKATAVVTSIDKTAPEATINYITNEDGSITAKISFNEETVITNNEGKDTYVFTKNGEFTFEFKDIAGNTGTAKATVTSIKEVEPDKTAPTITFSYTTTIATVGTPIGATITTDEDAIISYSWDNKTWNSSEDYVRSQKVVKTPTTAGSYTLYAKAIDKSSNASTVQSLQFTVVRSEEEIKTPEIIFEDLPIIQVNGVRYVRIFEGMTTENLASKMNKQALLGKTPEYIKLTKDNKLRTGSEITINGETKYIVVVKGDINCDGKAGDFIEDIMALNRYRIKGTGLSTEQILAGDINNDRIIDFIDDIMQINRYRIGIISIL